MNNRMIVNYLWLLMMKDRKQQMWSGNVQVDRVVNEIGSYANDAKILMM